VRNLGEITVMKRPIRTKTENDARIRAEGTNAAKRKAAANRALIEKAMLDIENDVEANDGIYPFADGRISIQEVLRRAGKANSPSYLNKKDPHIVELRREVDEFVGRALKRSLRGAKSIRKTVNERTEAAKDEAEMVRQAWHEAELEHNETLIELEKARKEIEELQAANTALMKKLSDKTVVDLPTRRK
jgi:hypothetical protein